MPVRELIRIDEEKCDGCGQCVPACAEGAIAIIDGKARLVGEVYCDGMGACLGHCPLGAITIERVEAAAFDEAAVARHLAAGRPPSPRVAPMLPAVQPVVAPIVHPQAQTGGCPGSRTMSWADVVPAASEASAPRPSELRQWPVQLHLLPPTAPYFHDAELLLAADCVAFAVGDFHRDFLAGRALAIACPKLDSHQEVYLEKLVAMIDAGGVRGVTVAIMQVPCCSGLLKLAQAAVARASRPVPLSYVVVGVQGETLASGDLGDGTGDRRPGTSSLPASRVEG
ncbi:MAG: 4Fe-4S binding protein [Acidobacteria bacterium]|nr:4Fe-4S binding protein [Acidobacteriota bacterium]